MTDGMAISCRLNGYKAYTKIFKCKWNSIWSSKVKENLHVISFYKRIFLFPDRGKEPSALIGGMLFIVSSMVNGSKEQATENSLYLCLKIHVWSFDRGWGGGGALGFYFWFSSIYIIFTISLLEDIFWRGVGGGALSFCFWYSCIYIIFS